MALLSPTPVTCIADLRRLAQRRLPRAIFDYVDGGSYDELTLRANRSDFDAIRLNQRVMIDVSTLAMSQNLIGCDLRMPIVLAPTGLAGLVHARGEVLAMQAAEAAGIPFTLSTLSICSIEDVAAAASRPFWFQLYVMKDRNFVNSLIKRATQAGCSTLVVAADLAVTGQRHRDLRNGLTVPPRPSLSAALDILAHPIWAWRLLRGRRWSFGNLAGHLPEEARMSNLMRWIGAQFEPAMTWDDVARIRDQWPGKLVVKGVLHPDDALAAHRIGADALVISNHGGRQLDSAPSSIAALPGIAAAVGDKLPVLMDGGIRCGQDVLKAGALGARAVMIGRAFLYGLAAGGQDGVRLALDLLRRELEVTMTLTGTRNFTDAGPHTLFNPIHSTGTL